MDEWKAKRNNTKEKWIWTARAFCRLNCHRWAVGSRRLYHCRWRRPSPSSGVGCAGPATAGHPAKCPRPMSCSTTFHWRCSIWFGKGNVCQWNSLVFPSDKTNFLENWANIASRIRENTYSNAKYSSRSCVVIFKMPLVFALYSQMTTVAINETRYGGRELDEWKSSLIWSSNKGKKLVYSLPSQEMKKISSIK